MQFGPANFFSNFNSRENNYSKDDIKFELEYRETEKAENTAAKKRCLVDGKRVKQSDVDNKLAVI